MTRAHLNRRLPRGYFANAPTVAQINFPARNEDRAGHGVEVAGAGLSSAPAFPDLLSAGEHQQLRAARLLNL